MHSRARRSVKVLFASTLLGLAGGLALRAASCGPFADVALSDPYCPAILEMYALGITAGTSDPVTTFSPTLPITRQALALMLARAARSASFSGSNRRAALDRFWTLQVASPFAINIAGNPFACRSDGTDLWVTDPVGAALWRVHDGDGSVVGAAGTGISSPRGLLVALNRVFVVGATSPGQLYSVDPTALPGPATLLTSSLGDSPYSITFDGTKLWTANLSGSISIIALGTWSVTPVSTGFTEPTGILFDGANVWVTDHGAGTLLRLDSAGAVLQTVTVGAGPRMPAFDGTNIWVPNQSSSTVTVVNAATGNVVTTLSGNGLNAPYGVAFDGQRVLVTDNGSAGDGVSVFRAADLQPLGFSPTGATTNPFVPCSDGIDFFVPVYNSSTLVRY